MSETFDRADGDTFAIQDEIAGSVANALQTASIYLGINQADKSREMFDGALQPIQRRHGYIKAQIESAGFVF